MSQATTYLKQEEGEESSPLPPRLGSPLVFSRETLFQQESGVTYRIPALLYIPPTSTFLAFAEKRSSARDEDAEYLVLRRGHQDGSSVQWDQVEELSTLVLPGYRTMNPCPLYDAATDTVILFCICVEQGKTEQWQIRWGCSAARLCLTTSSDGGRVWKPLQDVTEEAVGGDLPRWATFAVGPGHGVQLASGRLVVPAYTYYIHGCLCGVMRLPCYTYQHALVFYSDDGGCSWHKGDLVAGHPTGECQVAEIDGKDAPLLYCNARAVGGYRVVTFSTDRGSSFQPSAECQALVEPPQGCQGSVVSFSVTPEGKVPRWLLYSHPTDQQRRWDLGIYLNPSPLDGERWQRLWVLHSGPAGYSDLAVCPAGFFGCLFECGTASPSEEIAFCLFALATPKDGKQNLEAS